MSIGVSDLDEINDNIETINIFRKYIFKSLKILSLGCKINVINDVDKRNFLKLKGIFFNQHVLNIDKFFNSFELKNLNVLFLQVLDDYNGTKIGNNWKKLKNIKEIIINGNMINKKVIEKHQGISIKFANSFLVFPLKKYYKKV